MDINHISAIFLTWSPIITPILSVIYFAHNIDKRISILEKEYKGFSNKLEKIYSKILENAT